MINCPKCGFNQPKDQYCANCGIDMVTFTPEKPGVIKSISNSSAFYLVIVALVIFTAWHLWQSKKTQMIAERLRLTKSNYVNLNSQTTGQAANSTDPFKSENNPSSTQSELPESVSPPQNFASNNASENANPTTTSAAESKPDLDSNTTLSAKNLTYKVQVSFYEATSNFINDLMAQSQAQGKFFNLTDYSFGALWGGSFKITNALKNNEIKLLESFDISPLKLKMPLSKFIGYTAEDADQNLGFDISLSINDQSESIINIDFDITRSLKPGNDKNSPPIKKSFPGQLELKPNDAFFITGLLPYKVPSEVETELLSSKLFQIYQS